jgi:hypothetical protein
MVRLQVTKIHGYAPKLLITRIKIRIFLIDFQIGTGLYQERFLRLCFFFLCALYLIRILMSGEKHTEKDGWEWIIFAKRFFLLGYTSGKFSSFLKKWMKILPLAVLQPSLPPAEPGDDCDTCGILADEGILSLDLSCPLSDLAGFRIVLVPICRDLVLVYGILQRDLPLLQEFLSEMKTFAHTG